MKTMRLDKFLSNAKILTRKEAEKQIKYGNIKVNGVIATKKDQQVVETDIITYKDSPVTITQFIYIMLNKPMGYVSSTDDKTNKTVLDLIPEKYRKYDLFPCGRLDKDTVGLVILTNDGVGAHNLLSPKKHISKEYYFELADEILSSQIKVLEGGVTLKDGLHTKPCKITLQTNKSGIIILTEGKYHEIKRLFASTGNKVTYLKRLTFGSIKLDSSLKEGEYRLLNEQEIALFENSKK